MENAKDLAELSIREARSGGAQYAEARVQSSKAYGFMLKNGEPQPSVIEDSRGIGIRVLYDGALAFSATNLLSRASVRELSRNAVKMARASVKLTKNKVRFDGSKVLKKKWSASEKEKIEGADAEWLGNLLREVEGRLGEGTVGVRLSNRFLGATSGLDTRYYLNTDGARVDSRIPRLHFFGILTAIEGGQTAQRMIQQGQSGGLEVAERLQLPKLVEDEARMLGLVLRKAEKPPTGELDVVLGPELSGIAAHESVGHPQEADRVLGREGAQAGESYLKRESLGTKIGSDQANISDDPTIPHSNGLCIVDDEGVEARKRRLIKDGVITEYLQNRSTASELGAKNNGASRSTAFNREPIIRMSNTFVEPGDYSYEEVLKEVRHGVYFKSFTEWNIDDKRLNQRYVGLEAYLIKNGELKGLVKSPTLEITTPALWSRVKARSNRLEFEAAVCGKGDPMQGVPVWTGGPDTLLAGITLGAR